MASASKVKAFHEIQPFLKGEKRECSEGKTGKFDSQNRCRAGNYPDQRCELCDELRQRFGKQSGIAV